MEEAERKIQAKKDQANKQEIVSNVTETASVPEENSNTSPITQPSTEKENQTYETRIVEEKEENTSSDECKQSKHKKKPKTKA